MEDDQPMMNKAFEDMLALVAGKADAALLLSAWVRLGVEEYARAFGRSGAVQMLLAEAKWVEQARPSREWDA